MNTCPNCGKWLTLLTDVGPESAPWACFDCQRGWWPAELKPTARVLWDPATRSHGISTAAERVAVEREVDRAVAVESDRRKQKAKEN